MTMATLPPWSEVVKIAPGVGEVKTTVSPSLSVAVASGGTEVMMLPSEPTSTLVVEVGVGACDVSRVVGAGAWVVGGFEVLCSVVGAGAVVVG